MSKTKFGIALLGCGTVGSGVYELLRNQHRDIESKYGFDFEIRRILVKNTDKSRNVPGLSQKLLTSDFQEIMADSGVDIVIEVMGGEDAAKEYILLALGAGKSVITANKALMGKHGDKFIEKARQRNCFFGFSASVTGFHQFVSSMVKSLQVSELIGIFNGTTNFILSKLGEKPFEAVLKEAIDHGYAEANHTSDTSGYDTRNKLVVATKLAFGVFLDREEIPMTGITDITPEDIHYAAELGYKIKLLGISRIVEDQKLAAFVAPCLVPKIDPLARVNGVDNGIFVYDRLRPDALPGMSAPGAGKQATAMAIFSDLLSVARGERTLWSEVAASDENLRYTRNQPPARMYLRVDVPDQPGSMAAITKVFARNDINIVDLFQRPHKGASTATIVFLLSPTKQKTVDRIVKELNEAKTTLGKSIVLRVEHSPIVEESESKSHDYFSESPIHRPAEFAGAL